jgi:hypothetical protein
MSSGISLTNGVQSDRPGGSSDEKMSETRLAFPASQLLTKSGEQRSRQVKITEERICQTSNE